MEFIEQYHYASALFIARVFLGFLFLFQGYDAVVNIGMNQVINTYQERFTTKGIPRFLTALAAFYTSYSALVCGFLLVLGMFETASLYLLGVNILVTGIGFGINEPLWNTRNVFPRLALLLLLLLVPREWNSFSLDHMLLN